jgi:hypothetical protein
VRPAYGPAANAIDVQIRQDEPVKSAVSVAAPPLTPAQENKRQVGPGVGGAIRVEVKWERDARASRAHVTGNVERRGRDLAQRLEAALAKPED